MIGPAMDAVAPIRLAPVLQALWSGAAPYSFFDRAQEQFAEESADAWKRVLAFIDRYS